MFKVREEGLWTGQDRCHATGGIDCAGAPAWRG